MIQRCSSCDGAYHPAIGHAWTENIVLCQSCTLNFVKWLKDREGYLRKPWRKGLKSKESFIEAAKTSVKYLNSGGKP